MTTASPPGYSRLFATGLFLSTDLPSGPSGSRSTTSTPITTAPHTPLLEPATIRGTYTGATTLAIPTVSSSSRSPRRPKLAALRTHSMRTSTSAGSGSPSAGISASVPASPRILRRRKSSVTMSHNPIAAIKSPTRAAGTSGRAQSFLQAMGSPDKERRVRALDAVGERSMEIITGVDLGDTFASGKPNSATRTRRAVVARKPPPTVPLPAVPNQAPPLPTLTLHTTFPSPNSLSPALTPSPGVLPAPTPGAVELGLHKFSFANGHRFAAPRPARSPLVTSTNATPVDLGYFDLPIRGSSPVLLENKMEIE